MTVHFSDKEGSFEDECSPNPTEEESQFHILDLVISLFFPQIISFKKIIYLNVSNIFCLIHYIESITISTCNQYKNYYISSLSCVLHLHFPLCVLYLEPSQFELAHFKYSRVICGQHIRQQVQFSGWLGRQIVNASLELVVFSFLRHTSWEIWVQTI